MPKHQPVCVLHYPQAPALGAPHFSDSDSDEHRSYHTMGHYLRANVFPGPQTESSSLAKDSYPPHPPQAFIRDPEHWHGHKTDHLVKWTEQNFLEKRLHKLLKEVEMKGVSKRA